MLRIPTSSVIPGFLFALLFLGPTGCDKKPGPEPEPDACVPTTCAAEGRVCGSLDDGCGVTLACGTCTGANEHCDETGGVCACDHDACGDACCGADERCVNDQCSERGWYEVELVDAWAPDEYTVELSLSGDPGIAHVELAARYGLDSPVGNLTVTAVSYDSQDRQVTLTTSRQKLGVTYTVTVDRSPYDDPPLSVAFLAADTAGFWATDFSDPYFDDYWIVADRVGVGTHSVAYVEQGCSVSDTVAALAEFDSQVYPTLTQHYIAAPDFDGNEERIVLLGLDGESYYGGYFSPTNQYADDWTMSSWGRHSNEMDMIYINVLYGTWMVPDVATHEFGHLLYHERHGLQADYWDYHDEGLAEVGVHLVYGVNQYSLDFYFMDYQGLIGNGLSLVNWTWGQYENYAMAYLWWIYLASQAGDLSAVSEIFDLDSGDPTEVNTWISQNLGSDFATAQRSYLLANWLREPTGPYGYEGFLNLASQPACPAVSTGTTSVNLPPFAGTFFRLASASVDYPGTQGADLQYLGVNSTGSVDLTAPFDVDGGALLVFNASQSTQSAPQHSGPDLPALLPLPPSPMVVPRAWQNPPPVIPTRFGALRAWRERTLLRLAREGGPLPSAP